MGSAILISMFLTYSLGMSLKVPQTTRRVTTAAPVPDDWENDDDDDETNDEENRRIWEDAYVSTV